MNNGYPLVIMASWEIPDKNECFSGWENHRRLGNVVNPLYVAYSNPPQKNLHVLKYFSSLLLGFFSPILLAGYYNSTII